MRFGPPIRSNPLGELIRLRSTGTVAKYQEQFLKLLACWPNIVEDQQRDIFTAGLLNPLRTDVELQHPTNLEEAMSLARAYERRLELDVEVAPPFAPSQAGSPPPLVRSALSRTPVAPVAAPLASASPAPSKPGDVPTATSAPPHRPVPSPGTRFTCLSSAKMVERRVKGLCFNYLEKFTPEHSKTCTMKGIYLLELDIEITLDDPPEDLEISLYALTGIKTGPTMQLPVFFGNITKQALVDSGSTQSFLASTMARHLGLVPRAQPGLMVGVANGNRVPSTGVCEAVKILIHELHFILDFCIIQLEGYDVLGVQWLRTLEPILWDFDRLTMAFWRDDHKVVWHGLVAPFRPQMCSTTSQDLMPFLLEEFSSLFEPSTTLPPSRGLEHHIRLLPSTTPIAVRPYSYPQLSKDEIEQQCNEMLKQGIIRESSSPFSAPVLLVRKVDGSWRFCVDYRALNKTIKDKFPIPLIGELIDELQGARFFTKLDLHSGYHQIRMSPFDISKTAFCTHRDQFEFLVMPFRLTNALATFQALMNDVLKDFIRHIVLVFFDGILIYSANWAAHLQHVRVVFQTLHTHQLALKKSKCLFGVSQVAYLGHVISDQGVHMDPSKLEAV